VIEGRAKTLAFAALDALGVTEVWARLTGGVTILAYHGVTARPDDNLSNRRRLHVTVGRFVEHLSTLQRSWRPIALRDLVCTLREGKTLPERAVVLTFDDGYRNVGTVAAPLLRRFGVPFTVFVLTDPGGRRLWIDRLEAAVLAATPMHREWRGMSLDLESPAGREAALRALCRAVEGSGDARPDALASVIDLLGGEPTEGDDDRDLLSWDEVRGLRDAGADVGAHSDRHERLTGRPLPGLQDALVACRRALECELGSGPFAFCYPYGAWDAERASAVREAGFSCALTTDPGRNRSRQDLFALQRFLIGADDDVARVRASLSGLRALAQRRRQ
jgi:peptidoglycan/xylan/chitin deacetylase (PgdA/CDA1 family)